MFFGVDVAEEWFPSSKVYSEYFVIILLKD